MAKRNHFELNINAPIFEKLAHKKTDWWTTVCTDPELYINIRKYNRVSVYYKGASVMVLSYKNGLFFTEEIAKKYLDENWNCPTKQYQTEPEKIISNLDRIKENIVNHYNKRKYPEGASERELQGKQYIQGEYIDSEYEFWYSDPRSRIRIDLIAIRQDGMLEFVELKRISDNRLLHKEDSEKTPDILRQIHHYNRFINDYHSDIVNYYKKVQTIMKKIGIHTPFVNRKITGIHPIVKILFIPYADGKVNDSRRKYRIQRIADLLKENNIISNIDTLCK